MNLLVDTFCNTPTRFLAQRKSSTGKGKTGEADDSQALFREKRSHVTMACECGRRKTGEPNTLVREDFFFHPNKKNEN